MVNRVGKKVKLASLDELLGVQNTDSVVELDVNKIYPFQNHPFKVVDDENMEDLVESIKENGVLTPVLVRPDDKNTYEMISGHRRLYAVKKLGIGKIPAIIKKMSDDDATITMVDSNMQREEILPSERAFSFKMKMDAIKHQGKELKGSLFLQETKQHSGDIVGKSSGLNRVQVFRYIRLVHLISELLDMVDAEKLSLSVAVEISYLNHKYQKWILEYICENEMIKLGQLLDLRSYRENNSLTRKQMFDILSKSRSVKQTGRKITFSEKKLNKYFPASYSQAQIENIMISLLEQWKKSQEN